MIRRPPRSTRTDTLFPYTTLVRSAGLGPFAMMAADDGSFGYEMEIIVPADSPIKSPEDLKGKTLAFTAPTSNSGFKAPSAILRADFGLEADKDYKKIGRAHV